MLTSVTCATSWRTRQLVRLPIPTKDSQCSDTSRVGSHSKRAGQASAQDTAQLRRSWMWAIIKCVLQFNVKGSMTFSNTIALSSLNLSQGQKSFPMLSRRRWTQRASWRRISRELRQGTQITGKSCTARLQQPPTSE